MNNKKLFFEPIIEIPIEQVKYFVGKSISELDNEMEILRYKVQKASGYLNANSHFRITMHGKPLMKIGFYTGEISVWNFKTGDALVTFKSDLTMVDVTMLKDFCKKIEEGLQLCLECQKWVKEGKGYSYAGFVCWDCYNPKVHLPPDSS
jgi:hypothetical protein